MGLTGFFLSIVSVAPAALADYAVIALILKLPLRLSLGWAARGFPVALVLMAVMNTWQRPLEVSYAVCLGCILAARALQAIGQWAGTLKPQARVLEQTAS